MTNFKVEEANCNGKTQNETFYDLSCLFKDEEVMVVTKEKDKDCDLPFFFLEKKTYRRTKVYIIYGNDNTTTYIFSYS